MGGRTVSVADPSPTPSPIAPAPAVASLRAAHFRLTLEPLATIELSDFAGAVVRGGFGIAFKRTACPLRRQRCAICLLAPTCVYLRIFETPVPAGAPLLPAGGKAPHPFIIEPPEGDHRFAPGEPIRLGLTLLGDSEAQLPYFLYAFRCLGEMGLGRGRGRYRLVDVHLANPGVPPRTLLAAGGDRLAPGPYATPLPWLPVAPPADADNTSSPLTLHLHTPLRLKENGRYGARPTFPILIKQLLRRLTLIHACHCGTPPPIDHRAWIAAAAAVSVQSDVLTWCDLERYSTRQHATMRLGGWTGTVTYTGPWRPYRPLLDLAVLLHVGQGATFGLGRLTYHLPSPGESQVTFVAPKNCPTTSATLHPERPTTEGAHDECQGSCGRKRHAAC